MVVGTQKRGGSSKQKRPRTDMNFQVLPVNNYVQVHDTFTVRFPLLQFPPNINTTLACVVRAICFMTVYRLDVWNQRAQVMHRHYADQMIPQTQPRYTNPEGGGCKLDD